MVALHRLHVRLPYDADYSVLTGMVSIFKPKTRNRGARVQGTVITDELVLWLADAVWGRLPKHTALAGVGVWACSGVSSTFSICCIWKALP